VRQFEKYMEHFSDLPGWFDSPAIAIWDVLLTCQTQRGLTGNLLEIGVWKGKSAALMALHCEADETCILVDIEPMDGARARIGQIVPEAQCVYLQKSSPFLLQQSSLLAMAGNFRWLHIDGEHSSEIVTNDLQIADVLLGRLGMVVVDDFFLPGVSASNTSCIPVSFCVPKPFFTCVMWIQ
jgi:predicted O-methyltransferase YrrM